MDAKAQDCEPVNHLFTSKMYQTLCEAVSSGSAVQGAEDCVNIASNATAGQLNNSDERFYCAKIDRVRIPVSGGRFWAIVDKVDHHLISDTKWCIFRSHDGRTLYAQRAGGELMHRIIVGAKPGDGSKVDHRDGDGLNNTRENIRIGTQSQNLANQRQRAGTKSGFKGVSTCGDRWRAEIGYKRKRIYLGTFPTAIEAAKAYNAKALELFGPFTRLNPIPQQAAA